MIGDTRASGESADSLAKSAIGRFDPAIIPSPSNALITCRREKEILRLMTEDPRPQADIRVGLSGPTVNRFGKTAEIYQICTQVLVV